MNTNINDGGPAFPQPSTSEGYAANSPYGIAGGGMSLRDWFAGQALTGMLPSLSASDEKTLVNVAMPLTARLAYEIADAMLAARSKEAGK